MCSNFCVQHMLLHGDSQICRGIIKRVLPHVVDFSFQKFASNVVERCIDTATADESLQIMLQLCDSAITKLCSSQQCAPTTGADSLNAFEYLIRDHYGNYIIQRLLGVLRGTALVILIGFLDVNKSHIAFCSHEKQLMKAISKQSLRVSKSDAMCTQRALEGRLAQIPKPMLIRLGLRPQW